MNKLTATLIGGVVLSLVAPITAFAKHDNDKKDKDLPPGLQKKVDKGQPLPPGWQKKLRRGDILDYDIYDRGRVVVPIDRDGRISIEVEGSIIKLDEKSRKILDIINVVTY
ncbi:hypothetical protein CBX96_03575 [Shewanella sp. BC20]|uniref:hypothetical protein n=1 Tax=Shewanella sp. BC20 TaxID=2004459 RepID=UPI000D64844B|nr:hypothetical protein [Shewanella sp. BC20]PWF64859.1 hypothetical protein CBX96_03575 [Shewanella sp. BC20]